MENKNLIEIDGYQNNILKVSKKNLSRDNLIRLYTELQNIKTEANIIKPLPPVNFPALLIYSFKEVEGKENHRTILSYEKKKLRDMVNMKRNYTKLKKVLFLKVLKL